MAQQNQHPKDYYTNSKGTKHYVDKRHTAETRPYKKRQAGVIDQVRFTLHLDNDNQEAITRLGIKNRTRFINDAVREKVQRMEDDREEGKNKETQP